MAKTFLTNIDLKGNQLLNAVIHSASSAPTAKAAGQLYYNTNDSIFYYSTGTGTGNWTAVGVQFITSVGSNLSVTAGELTLGNKVVITDATQTLSGKSLSSPKILGPMYVQSGGGAGGLNNTITANNSTGVLEIDSGYGMSLSATGNIIINPSGDAYLGSVSANNKIATIGDINSTEYINSVDHGLRVTSGKLSLDIATGLFIDQNNNLAIDGYYYYDKSATNNAITDAIDALNLATTYDAYGAASTAQSNAEGYTDTAISGLSSVYDAYGAASTAQSNAEGYTDTAISGLSSVYDAYGAASTAQSNAEGYTDTAISGLSSVYDAYGAASTAQSNAEGYTDTAITNLGVGGTATGDVVTIDATQTLTNKTLGTNTALSANLDAATYKITGLANPTDDQEAATKSYVDAKVNGLTWKNSVNVLAETNVPLTGSTPLSIDSHTISDGYRVLLINQTTSTEDGIYDVAISGGSYALTRSADAFTYAELIGASVYVIEGTSYNSTTWVQSNSYLTSFASQSWSQTSGAGAYTTGVGLDHTGTQFFVKLDETGDGSGLAVSSSGIAVSLATNSALSTIGGLHVVAGSGITTSGGSVAVDTSVVATKYASTITGDSTNTSFAKTHGLGTNDVQVRVYQLSAGPDTQFADVEVDIVRTSTNEVTISFASAPSTGTTYRVVVIG